MQRASGAVFLSLRGLLLLVCDFASFRSFLLVSFPVLFFFGVLPLSSMVFTQCSHLLLVASVVSGTVHDIATRVQTNDGTDVALHSLYAASTARDA